jgi:hypothetical protein
VAALLAKYVMFGIIRWSPSIDGRPYVLIPSQRRTDLNYIKWLAKRVGYIFIDAGPAVGTSIA